MALMKELPFRDLVSAVAHHSAVRPDAIAARFGTRSTTFAELHLRSNRVANRLVVEGVGPGDRVAYVGTNTDRYLEVLLGAAKIGAITVGVNWRLAGPEVAAILSDADVEVLFVGSGLSVPVDDLVPLVRRKLVVDIDDGAAGAVGFSDWLDSSSDADPDHVVDPEDTLVLAYTSGTTGLPKGAEISHRALANVLRRMVVAPAPYWSAAPGTAYITTLPLTNISGAQTIFGTLSQGCCLLIVVGFDPSEVLELISTYDVQFIGLAPTMLQMLLDDPGIARADLARLRWVSYGSAPMPTELLARAMSTMRVQFAQGYGMTENAGMAAQLGPEDHHSAGSPRTSSVGRALEGVEVKIVDSDGRSLPVGHVGEVWIRSDSLMKGYWRQPAATAAAVTEGWLHTGDAAFVDADGYIFLKDRIKDMIISGGLNVYPAEVENALFGHPAIREVGVIGVPHEKWGEVPHAVIVLEEGSDFDPEDLRRYASARIARYKVPAGFTVVDTLPKNASQKVQRRDLRQLVLGRSRPS